MRRLEKSLERSCLRYFKLHYGRVGVMLKFSVLSWRGWPDRLILARVGSTPKIVFLELKRDAKSEVKKHQQRIHQLIARIGFPIYVVNSYEDFVKICETELETAAGGRGKEDHQSG